MSARRPLLITRSWAYMSGTITLCRRHDNSEDARGSLGQVVHGYRRDPMLSCEVCSGRRDAELRNRAAWRAEAQS